MAEFNEIARKFERMHESCRSCDECPLHMFGSMRMKNLCTEFGFFDPEFFVRTVEQWAEEHPEPQYPTWREFLEFAGVLEHESDYSTAGIVIARERISAEIAEKLGIEPKEDG